MKKIDVALGEKQYSIAIGSNLLSKALSFSFTQQRQVVVVSNDTIAPLHADSLLSRIKDAGGHAKLFTIPDGEQHKTLQSFADINTFLLQNHYGRDTLLIAFGGGVIGDLVGFVAACYQRGIDYVQIPTTLLAQVDSSVGGKTAVNHPLGKNMIGAFYQPNAVLIDIDVLKTLPEREYLSGLAEVIKCAIIADGAFFEWLEQNIAALLEKDPQALSHAIHQSCLIKANIVAQDEKEAGQRALLNLGHTFGHAIETQMGYGTWLHGEAVSAGIVMAATLANLQQLLSAEHLLRIKSLLKKAKLPIQAPKSMDYASFIKHMLHDKKILGGKLRFVLPTDIGAAKIVADIKEASLIEVINTH
ncbi:MAG: 3-dehydroquinate synthase [Vibrionaceae bacterium]